MSEINTAQGLYTDKPRIEGEVPEHRPDQFASTKAVQGDIRFGRAVMTGDADDQVKVYEGDSKVFKGVSLWSKDASYEDPDETENPLIVGYREDEAAGILEKGVVNVLVTEAVDLDDPVRIWRAEEADTAGYQEIEFDSAKAGGDSTGLANDSTAYTMTVKVDGVDKAISVVGSAAQTFTNLISEVDTDLAAAATCSIVGGNFRITSATTGDDSSVAITDGDTNPLAASLTDFAQIGTAVPGSDDPLPANKGAFCTTAVAGKTTLLAGAKFASKTTGYGIAAIELNGRASFATTDDT